MIRILNEDGELVFLIDKKNKIIFYPKEENKEEEAGDNNGSIHM
jgi:hypothetical protein